MTSRSRLEQISVSPISSESGYLPTPDEVTANMSEALYLLPLEAQAEYVPHIARRLAQYMLASSSGQIPLHAQEFLQSMADTVMSGRKLLFVNQLPDSEVASLRDVLVWWQKFDDRPDWFLDFTDVIAELGATHPLDLQ